MTIFPVKRTADNTTRGGGKHESFPVHEFLAAGNLFLLLAPCNFIRRSETDPIRPNHWSRMHHPTDKRDSTPHELATVAVYYSTEEAELARSFLAGRGIIAHVGGGVGLPHLQGVPYGGMLQVSKGDARRASRLLRKVRSRRPSDQVAPLNLPTKIVGFLLVFFLLSVLGLVLLALGASSLSR